MLKNENIVCISTIGWDFLWTRKQRFMDMLTKNGNRVLYVEHPISFLAKLFSRHVNLNYSFRCKLRKVREDLYVLTPPMLLPLSSQIELFARVNQIVFSLLVKRWVAKLGFKNIILWIYDPFLGNRLLNINSKKISLYGCVDEQSAKPRVKKSVVQKMEQELLKKVDMVFVTAKGLLPLKKKVNDNTFFVPNGVDFELFSKACYSDLECPSDLINLHKPILGFIGGIFEWIDLNLIKFVAETNPRWSIVLIGPVRRNMSLSWIKSHSNVFFLGRKDMSVLPTYLKYIDVCLSPFKVNTLTKTVNPLKVYEYLAAGKPVVSTDMPELYHLDDVVYIAKSYDEFVRKIKLALIENDCTKTARRQDIAKDYSWEKLLALKSEIIEGFLAWRRIKC